MVEDGYLISNQKAVNFFTWASKNPTRSHQRITKEILKDVKAFHLPVFREGIDIYNNDDFGFGMTKNDIESELFSSSLNHSNKSISVERYLEFLNRQKLTNTYYAIPLIKKVNANSLRKTHQLKTKLASLIPEAKHEKLTYWNNQINSLNNRIKDVKTNIVKLEKKINHWWISKRKVNDLLSFKDLYFSKIKDLKKKQHNIKDTIHQQLNIFNKLYSDFNYGFEHAFDDKNDPDDLFDGDEAIYINGKQYSISPYNSRYSDGKVFADLTNIQLETVKKLPNVMLRNTKMNRQTKKDLADDTDNTFTDFDVTFTKPNADLAIKALYSTIMNLPYINLNKLPKVDCLQSNLTKDKIFCNTNDGVTLGDDSRIDVLDFVDTDVVSDYKNYHQLASKMLDKAN